MTILTFDFVFFYCSLTELVLDDAIESLVVECVVGAVVAANTWGGSNPVLRTGQYSYKSYVRF